MNFATTKERIIQYIDFKGIKVKDFYEKTGIKRGFLDSDKLKSSVSDIFLTIIFANFEDLDPIWLLTGEGSMLKSEPQPAVSSPQPQENDKYISSLEKQISLLEKNNALQEEKIAHLEKEIKRLKGKDIYIMEEKIENQRKEIATLKNQALANTPYIPPSARK